MIFPKILLLEECNSMQCIPLSCIVKPVIVTLFATTFIVEIELPYSPMIIVLNLFIPIREMDLSTRIFTLCGELGPAGM